MVRAVAALELAGTADARKLLTELAEGGGRRDHHPRGEAALERIGR